jgi:hypothetical protein
MPGCATNRTSYRSDLELQQAERQQRIAEREIESLQAEQDYERRERAERIKRAEARVAAAVSNADRIAQVHAVTKIAARLRGKAARARVKSIKAKLSVLDTYMDTLIDDNEQGEAGSSAPGLEMQPRDGGFVGSPIAEPTPPLVPTDWASRVMEDIGQREALVQ